MMNKYVFCRKIKVLLIAVLFLAVSITVKAAEPVATDMEHWLRQGSLKLHLRNYYLYRGREQLPFAETMAGGGWLAYQSALWHNMGFGLAGYTAQGWGFTDPDHDGAGVLASDQKSYAVLGQAYLRFAPGNWNAVAYRQSIDTPFINPDDCRMTPRTVEAYTLENSSISGLHLTLSHVTAQKGRTDTTFHSMSAMANEAYPELAELGAVNRGVTLGGLAWTPEGSDLGRYQVWNYYAYDYMNTFYVNWEGAWQASPVWGWHLALQAMDQRDTGDALGGEFRAAQAGIQSGVHAWGLELILAATITDSRYHMQSPWGSYPGFTSLVLEDNNRAGDKAWATGLKYNAAQIGLNGLTVCAWHAQSVTPDSGAHASPDQQETDFIVDYKFSGFLRNLIMRLCWADVRQSATAGGQDYTDYRVIVNYTLDFL